VENKDLSSLEAPVRATPTRAANRGADEAMRDFASREPAIDLVHLARQTDGDEALEAGLLALFDRQLASLLPALADAGLPRRARADLAHKLRGSALAIGAARVAAAAEALEIAFESGSSAVCEPASEIGRLTLAVTEARAAIAEFRD
jgi:HPt (histidine-containing phosphotransfer) domain-containing protein